MLLNLCFFKYENKRGKCSYNVTLRRVHETTVVENNKCYIFLCVCVDECMHARPCVCGCTGCGRVLARV